MEYIWVDAQPTVSYSFPLKWRTRRLDVTELLTVTRVEDWPVMPCDIFQLHFKPADFFSRNPAIDVPSARNEASVLVGKECCAEKL